MGLDKYNHKRDFNKTAEPKAGKSKDADQLHFVIQKHDASHLHYDFRLEMEGVLKSWAVPKGPSTDPKVKRLAMMVEDHPYDYKDFEGIIPKGEYGGGTVIVWDEGTYEPIEEIKGKKAQDKYLRKQLKEGSLKIKLQGKKLKGEFALVKTRGMGENGWLLIKHKDDYAATADITKQDKSVLSGKTIAAMEQTSDKVWQHGHEEKLEKAPKKKIPIGMKPMLATLVDEPFDDPDWVYEVKWDGYRALGFSRKNGDVQLLSRNNKPFNEKFYPIYEVMQNWKIDAVVDGEILVLNDKGVSNFAELQNWRSEADGELVYYVFDLIWYDGKDLTGLSLLQRQAILKSILPQDDDRIRLSKVFTAEGTEFFEAAKKMGLEGIIAKKGSSTYTPGNRSTDWLKIKINKRQEVVIAGFTKNKDSSKQFSSLLLGVYERGHLQYVGKVGTGFSDQLQKEMMKQFEPLMITKSPFDEIPDVNKPSRFRPNPPQAKATWLKPELVCEVAYAEVTSDGVFRHPSFQGMRIDKKAKDVIREAAVETKAVVNLDMETDDMAKTNKHAKAIKPPKAAARKTLLNPKDETQVRKVCGHELKFTHLSKVYWPEDQVTKRDLFNYYYQVAEYILPYLKDRPMSLNRFPGGINGQSFYQKDVKGKAPDWARTFPYTTGEGEAKEYLVGDDEATLLWMVSLGCIEMNPWFSRVKSPDNPDYCVIDLDPDKQNFDQVVEAALTVKEVCDQMDVPSFCKTSGSTGIHIYIPLAAKYSYDQSQMFARIIVSLVHQRIPEYTSLERMIPARKGKMYLDFLQNRPGATIAGPYSLRPKPGATVSMPLHWEEVKPGLKMTDFTIFNALERLKSEGDFFRGVLGKGIDLEKTIHKAKGVFGNS
ncbi:DNA ligase D [Pedobacter heparinus]|uniref:DNA ligase (ATP) n=1 Tax=Pedobacter heparinus (strain ATCC 13125 / DSM 2366 / CIP 104194 / JCM 7457 / NBRC 12017 / NCIMB 9290 / NRRL B-14731 / HIM 762-3) TaxID=485917 RepID=C6XUR3_PEDHD|nr:DNA ligase D [Pedobacter heparinus]ACU03913.1 DNA ligase D [Pedobacter heparinus DSM 2366]